MYGNKRKSFLSLIVVFSILMFFPTIGTAQQWNSISKVAAGEVVDRTVFMSGDEVTIEGTVKGDVFAAGRIVTIQGIVEGDVIAAANDIRIQGEVKGDVRAAAQHITVDGKIEKNALLFAQTVTVSDGAVIAGESTIFAQNVKADGDIQKHMQGAAQTIDITGRIGGDVTIYGVERLSVTPTAKMEGKLTYTAPQTGDIAEGVVAGPVDFHMQEQDEEEDKEDHSFSFPLWFPLLSALLLTVILHFIGKRAVYAVGDRLDTALSKSIGIGLLVLIAVPILCIVLLITVIGIPISIMLALLYGILWYVSTIVIGMWLGQRFMQRVKWPLLVKELIGVIILVLLTQVPLVGWLFGFAAAVLFFGGVVTSFAKPRTGVPV